MNSLYISDIVPKDDVKRYNASQASCNFNNHIQQLGYFNTHIAIPPINVGKGYKSFIDEAGIEYHAIRPLQHKGVLKYLNCLLENIWLFRRIMSSMEKNIWFYNISKINCYAYWMLSVFSNKSLYVLMADYNPERNKGFIGKLILKGIKNAKGIISLTSRCGELNDNIVCIPGIVPMKKIAVKRGTISKERIFMISGVLSKNTGIEMALQVFSEIPTAKLIISGKGDVGTESLCKTYSDRFRNIEYFGFIDNYEDFLTLLNKADFILSFRDPSKPVNKYNFPSKILESLAMNKVVISTQKYEELTDVNYIYAPYNKQNLIELINEIMAGMQDEIIEKCLDNSKIIIERFTEEAWIKAFKKLENE